MKSRGSLGLWLIASTLVTAAGCADLLGLQPPNENTGAAGSAGTGTTTAGAAGTTTAGGSAGAAGTMGGTGGTTSHGGSAGMGGTIASGGTSDTGGSGGSAMTGGSGGSGGVATPGDVVKVVTLPGTVASTSSIRAITADAAGNVYIAGLFNNVKSEEQDVFGCKLTLASDDWAYVAKLDENLGCQWISSITPSMLSSTLDTVQLTVTTGHVWVLGNVIGDASVAGSMGSRAIPANTSNAAFRHGFVVSFDAVTGAVSTVHTLHGGPFADGEAITAGTLAMTEHVLVAGLGGQGQITFNDPNMMPDTLPFQGGGIDPQDILVASLNAGTGKLDWARRFGSPGADVPLSLALMGGNLLIGGGMGGGLSLGNCSTPMANIAEEAFAIGFDALAGDPQTPTTCVHWGMGGNAYTNSLAAIDAQTFFAAGSVTGKAVNCVDAALKGNDIPSTNGWARHHDSISKCDGGAVFTSAPSLDSVTTSRVAALGGDAIVTGDFGTILSVTGDVASGRGVYVHRYGASFGSPDPNPKWHAHLEWTGNDYARDIVVTPEASPRIFVVGSCGGSAVSPASAPACGPSGGFLAQIQP